MHTSFAAVLAFALAASLPAVAQTGTQPAPATTGTARPARGPEQSSVPTAAPPATPQQITGAQNQDPKIKQMNEGERAKVEKEGK